MKIQQLDVKGFRSLKDIHWEPEALNVVIGPNGSGKSNLLRLLEMIAASARGELKDFVQESGGSDVLLWDGVAEQPIDYTILFFDSYPTSADNNQKPDKWAYEVSLAAVPPFSELCFMHETLSHFDVNIKCASVIQRVLDVAETMDKKGEVIEMELNSKNYSESILSLYTYPISENFEVSNLRNKFSDWAIYHDFHVDREADIRKAAITRMEERINPDGQNLIPVLHTLYANNRDFKQEVNTAMKAAFGDDFDELIFPPAADQRIQLRVRWKSLKREQSAADLSDGMLRFLLLLTILAAPSPPPLIAIDEPETGLHPAMLPIIAEYAVDASQRTQVILTTHSPQFLDAFGDTRPATTVMKWSDGETILKKLKGDRLEEWLKDYTLGALFRSGELEEMG